jgi:hypothetical protein
VDPPGQPPGGGPGRVSAPVSEAPAVVAGLDDVAVMGDAIEQRGRHLGIAEHGRPFPNARFVVMITEVRS